MHNFELILISDESFSIKEIPIVEWALSNGFDRFHLRKKTSTQEEINTILANFNNQFLPRITVHYFHNLAPLYAAEVGQHHSLSYKKQNGSLTVTPDLITPIEKQSYSIHTWNEIKEIESKCAYAFISPVFTSISKLGYHNETLLKESTEFLPSKKCRIIALGGIRPEHLQILKSNNFNGAAILGAVWQSDTPAESLQTFINCKKSLN